jgi:Bacteriocin class II with double-glycine leader peptide
MSTVSIANSSSAIRELTGNELSFVSGGTSKPNDSLVGHVANSAATGAAIGGSIGGGVGAAVGGAIGAVVGFVEHLLE